jgi:hypothetical protein
MRTAIPILLAMLLHTSPAVAQVHHEQFREFASSFFTDSTYQSLRISYPLLQVTLNMNTLEDDTVRVNEGNWTFTDFGYLSPSYAIQTYDNFQKSLRPSGERVISFEGIENGINLSLYFRLINHQWYLVKIVNHST